MTTTYFNRISAIASAKFTGSFASRSLGFPWPTSQKGQRRVQISPIIINVAVPPEKHSPKLGQAASSQTLDKPFLRNTFLILSTSGDAATLTRIQSGLRNISSVAITLTGIRSTLSASRNFSPLA